MKQSACAHVTIYSREKDKKQIGNSYRTFQIVVSPMKKQGKESEKTDAWAEGLLFS